MRMNFEIVSAILLAVFAVTCMVTGMVFGAWWHFAMGVMSGSLSWAIWQDEREDSRTK